jgi:hypothetical protein
MTMYAVPLASKKRSTLTSAGWSNWARSFASLTKLRRPAAKVASYCGRAQLDLAVGAAARERVRHVLLQRDLALHAVVERAVDDAEAAFADEALDREVADHGPRRQRVVAAGRQRLGA